MASSPFKQGMKVRQVLPKPEEGFITDIGIDRVDGERLFLVAWTDADGTEHNGWYKETEIEVSPEDAEPAPE
jgi:hypothetical protein